MATHEQPSVGYGVYARHDREPRIHQLGEVHATGTDDAAVFAYTLYDERRWQDMFLVPQSAIVSLIRPE